MQLHNKALDGIKSRKNSMLQRTFDLGFSVSISLLVAFGIWTVFCHLNVFLSADFNTFVTFSYVGFAFSLIGAVVVYRNLGTGAFEEVVGNATEFKGSSESKWIMHLAFGLVLVLLSRITGSYDAFWALSVLYLVWQAIQFYSVDIASFERGVQSPVTLATAILIAAVLAYVLTRTGSSLDDSFYINLIIGMLDYPDLPILWKDTLFGPGELPIHSSAYMVKSFEPLQAVLIHHFDIDPIVLRQFIFAPVAAIVSVILWAKCCQFFMPRNWEPLLALFLLMVLMWSTQFRMVGNFYFEYLMAGKVVLVACVIPGLIYATIQWCISGKLIYWLILSAINIAAVGLTPNGLYTAPITVGLLLCGFFTFNPRGLLRLTYGVGACFYPVIVGFLLLLNLEASPSENLELETISDSLRSSLGWDWRYWVLLPIFAVGWSVHNNESMRRLLLLWTLAFMLFIANPLFEDYWADYVTGNLNWRLIWSFPILLIAALAIQSIATKIPVFRDRHWIIPIVVLSISVIVKNFSTLSYNVWDQFGLGKRVDLPEYNIAQDINRFLGPADTLLAPRNISAYTVTLNDYPFPLVTRPLYLIHMREKLPMQELIRRAKLYTLVAPDESGALEQLKIYVYQHSILSEKDFIDAAFLLFEKEIKSRSITCVVISPSNRLKAELSEYLQENGYNVFTNRGYEIWLEPSFVRPSG